MAVTIVKPKAKEVSKYDASQIVLADTVDEFATKKAKLDAKMAKIAPLSKEVTALEKGILGAVDEVLDPSASVSLLGNEFELKVGPQGSRLEITNTELLSDMLGMELFLKLAKVSVTDLKAYLTPDQLVQVTKSEFAIKRRVKVETL
jgi:hypothetical protein